MLLRVLRLWLISGTRFSLWDDSISMSGLSDELEVVLCNVCRGYLLVLFFSPSTRVYRNTYFTCKSKPDLV